MSRPMTIENSKNWDEDIPQEATQLYIRQMLEELSVMAKSSGLKDMAYLLKATAAASQFDFQLESDA